MATQWDDILTVTEVQNAALESSSAVEDNPNEVVEAAIRDEQDRIATFLGMDPMVHRLKQGMRERDWKADPTLDPEKEVAWADHQPIVEVENPSDVGIRHDNQRFTHEGASNLTVDYFAGWKRSDQSLADLNGNNSGTLTDLNTAPSDLPRDLRRTAIALVLFQIMDTEQGKAIGQVDQVVGSGGTITVQGTQQDFIERQLRRIASYKVKGFGA